MVFRSLLPQHDFSTCDGQVLWAFRADLHLVLALVDRCGPAEDQERFPASHFDEDRGGHLGGESAAGLGGPLAVGFFFELFVLFFFFWGGGLRVQDPSPEFLDSKHVLGLDHFSGKQKTQTLCPIHS